MYRGVNAAVKFVCGLQQEAKQLFDEYIAIPKPMLLTATELRSFNNVTTCHICLEMITCDHCHIVGGYNGSAHNECNLVYGISKSGWKLPVFIHNLKGYDGHLIVKALTSEFGKVQVIPQNMEKYLPPSVAKLKFTDSVQFNPKGLDFLAKTLEDDEFR